MTIRRSAFLGGMRLLVASAGIFVVGGCAAEVPKPSATEVASKVHSWGGGLGEFPEDPDGFRRLVDACLSGPTVPMAKPPIALIVPHAGYKYSGTVAGKAYATLKGRTYRRVLLFGPSHRARVRGASVLRVDAYETPLGRIPVDIEARDALLKCPVVSEQPAAHKNEHSVENELPLLQGVLKDFRMVEVLVGDMTSDERATLADAVRALVGEGTLLVVSSDFTHYGPNYGFVPFKDRVPENLRALNDMAVQELLQVDVPGWDAHVARTRDTVCGAKAIGLVLKVLEPWDDVQAVRAAFDTSGRMTGDYTNSVTYASLVFWRTGKEAYLKRAERRTLLHLARDVLKGFIETHKTALDETRYDLAGTLKKPGAAFVTLKNHGRLRGCIGTFVAQAPLYQTIAQMACAAAQDFRFRGDPVTSAELADMDIEISVLTPLEKVRDPLKEIEIGRHGIYIEGRGRSGCFLPQVATETGWSKEEFLSHCAVEKAGLAPDAWKKPGVTVYRFEACVFGEKEEAVKP